MLSRHLSSFFYLSDHHQDLHSFPTRRSSDLTGPRGLLVTLYFDKQSGLLLRELRYGGSPIGRINATHRSEEHTSELQSPDHLVCRLLLEKKKKTISCRTTTATPAGSTASTAR